MRTTQVDNQKPELAQPTASNLIAHIFAVPVTFMVLMTLAALLWPRCASARSLTSNIGPFAYVTNHNDSSVSVIDTSSNTVTTTIFDLCDCDNSGAAGVAVAPGGKFVYVANESAGTVSVIDTSTNSVTTTIPLACPGDCSAEPVGVAITPNGALVYVTDAGHAAVYVIQTSDNTVLTTITTGIGANPFGVAVDPTGSFVYVTNGTPGPEKSVSVVSTATNAVTGSISVGTNPTSVAFQPGAHVAYVTNAGDGTVSIINTATNTVTNTVSAGSSPYFVAFTPNGASAYITNQAESASVTVIDTTSQAITNTISVGSVPVQIAITPDGNTAYVAIGSGTTVTPIPTSTNTPGSDITVGNSPFGVAIGPAMESATLGNNAQTITFLFLNGGASISFTFPQGWCVNAPCTITTAATDTPDAVWRTESANYPGTDIAPITELPGGGNAGGDGLVYTVTCKDSTGAICNEGNTSDTTNYSTTTMWDTNVDICGMGPGLGKEETMTWENILGTCTFTADPSGTTSGTSKDGLSRWASFYHVTGTSSASVTITTPPNGAVYTPNQVVDAAYTCGGTFFECAGTVANGSPIDTSTNGLHTFTAEADVTSGPTAKQTVVYFVGGTYGVQLLYPANAAVKSPATFPIKMYLTFNGTDVSSSALGPNAFKVLFINGNASGDPVVWAGSSNADSNFRFDSTLGPSGGYIFNFKTSGLPSGNYLLEFTVAGDPIPGSLYAVPFAVK